MSLATKVCFAVLVLCYSVGIQLFFPQVFEGRTPREELEAGELRFWLMIAAIGAVIALVVMAVKAIKSSRKVRAIL